jgi:hypothetical protein
VPEETMTYRFYATFDVGALASYIPAGIPVLLPASSWARKGLKPPIIPEQITETAADSGGYVASKVWGDYRYSLDEYVNWLLKWRPGPPSWVAMMDYCCEPELKVVTRERQDRTTANAWQAWDTYKEVNVVWTPTIQGLEPSDYQRHANELAPLIAEMQHYYIQRGQKDLFRVGIGTLCRRANAMTIWAIVQAVRTALPDVQQFHMWGVKLAAISALDMPNLDGDFSSDSAAWSDQMYNSVALREEAKAAGMSQRQYSIMVKLPAYMAKITEAAARPARLPNQERERVVAELRSLLQARGWTLRLRSRRVREFVYAVRHARLRMEEKYVAPLDSPDVVALAAMLPNMREK